MDARRIEAVVTTHEVLRLVAEDDGVERPAIHHPIESVPPALNQTVRRDFANPIRHMRIRVVQENDVWMPSNERDEAADDAEIRRIACIEVDVALSRREQLSHREWYKERQ